MLCRRLALCCTLLLVGAVSAQDEVEFLASPTPSLNKTRQLLDAADLRVLMPLGYEPTIMPEASFTGRAGVIETRSYLREDGKRMDLIDLAIVRGVAGGYDFALAGQRVQRGSSRANPDLSKVSRALEDLLRESSRSGSTEPERGYEMYRLGHIEADRALAMLKVMGYNTIEFSAGGKAPHTIFDAKGDTDTDLPIVVKVVNASKTSLMEASTTGKKSKSAGKKGGAGAPQLGGEHLHSTTSGAPEERLLLIYDRNEPEPLERLINTLRTQVDLPAQQIVIEALVIEINLTDVQDLGVEWSASHGNVSGQYEPTTTSKSIGTFLFSRDTFSDFLSFRGRLEALAEKGKADVLSSPQVLVLNDRQARIQVGRQIPVSKTTSTTSAVSKGIEYFPIGIVLNLRPRIDHNGAEVTMQIETIISSISPESQARLEDANVGVEFAPIVDNRLVETYVRVADGTPFIIGGLLSENDQRTRAGLPLLSNIPLLRRLFSRERVENQTREVIVVITPHIVPLDDNSFSYLIPKDTDKFDRRNYKLFRDAYRVRDSEVWDLKFIRHSPVLQNLVQLLEERAEYDATIRRQPPFSTLLSGDIPGEEVLVRTMLADIISYEDMHLDLKLDQTFFFHSHGKSSTDFTDGYISDVLERVSASPASAVMLTYEARPQPGAQNPFSYPVATLRDTIVPTDGSEFMQFLQSVNSTEGEDKLPNEWTIVLANEGDVNQLKKALVLKLLLELNTKLPLTLQAFRPGVQVLIPTPQDIKKRYHLIDGYVAQLFYETSPNQYYPAFERIFNRTVRQINGALGRK